MMNQEQAEVVKTVYARFIGSEDERTWTDLDSNLEFFSYLDDSELVKESEIKHYTHSDGVFRCSQNHDQVNCFAPYILEAVGYILDLYYDTKELHAKNRYILSFYLSMSELGMIFNATS